METKHTPGPWTVETDKDLYGSYFIHQASIEQETAESEEEHKKAKIHDEGNAYLIAAAPELLDVCQRAIDLCIALPRQEEKYKDLINETLDRLCAAMPKAKEAHHDKNT